MTVAAQQPAESFVRDDLSICRRLARGWRQQAVAVEVVRLGPSTKPAATAPQRPARRARPTDTQFDADAPARGVLSKLRARGDAGLERVLEGVRRAIAILQTVASS